MVDFDLGYYGLFTISFLAATFLPIASEVFLATMIAFGFSPIGCLVVATAGNTLGSYLNYFIGYLGNPKWLSKIGVKDEKILNWQHKIQRHGVWIALLAWLPFVGDVLSTALGFFRVQMLGSFFFIFIGKLARYLILVLFLEFV